MSSSIVFRKAKLTDKEFIVTSQMALALESENLVLDKETVSAGAQHIFDTPTEGVYYVSELNGEVVACLLTLREWSEWNNKVVIWVHSVYVLPKARKRGIFKTMYAEIKSMVMENPEYQGLRLYVDKTNTVAIKTYESLGMNGEHYQLYEWIKK